MRMLIAHDTGSIIVSS